jgi:hypothetical protein
MRSDLVVMALLAVAACGPQEDPQDPPMQQQQQQPGQPTAATAKSFLHVNDTLQKSCAFSVCHSPHGMASSGKLDLSHDAWLALVNVAPQNAKALEQGMKLVKPCDPEHSFLFLKLSMSEQTEQSGEYGGHMPASNAPLSAEELQLIHDWIARGARLAEPPDATGTACAY